MTQVCNFYYYHYYLQNPERDLDLIPSDPEYILIIEALAYETLDTPIMRYSVNYIYSILL